MAPKILLVAEKPSIAKAVSNHLAPGAVQISNVAGTPYVKNYTFDFDFPTWGQCTVTMTSVLGHLTDSDFTSRYKSWTGCSPLELFEAPITISIAESKRPIAENIRRQSRNIRALFIWTDCDREGEHIGSEIRDVVLSATTCDVVRARFSNIERAHVLSAARNPVPLDERQVQAVSARQELDLRIGASFTRWQTKIIQGMGGTLRDIKIVSFGPCQIPTLGFVVDRYWRVRNFIPEPFYKLTLWHTRDTKRVQFLWKRHHLFDRMATTILFERCLATPTATVTKVEKKPTSKWRPLPLTTVELQKCGSRFLRMDSARVMETAEKLYNAGYISYPRTETDTFDPSMDLKSLITRQQDNPTWGDYATSLLQDSNYKTPRSGRHNDQAHPPIHPVNPAPAHFDSPESARVYEFVTRRFLACCSDDAHGESNTVQLSWSSELFTATGLLVTARNYLDVYPYDVWTSSQQLPLYTLHEQIPISEPEAGAEAGAAAETEATLEEGKTSKPNYLSEPELIALMDANGIGTDATMAEHISKIKEREYVTVLSRSPAHHNQPDNEESATSRGRGSGRGSGRGRARGRAGRQVPTATRSTAGPATFIPTTLGVSLIQAYSTMSLSQSLDKPHLRKEMELKMKSICESRSTKHDVVHQSIEMYRGVFVAVCGKSEVLRGSVRRYVLGEGGS